MGVMPCPHRITIECNVTTFSLNITESTIQPLVSENVLWWLRMVVVGVICQAIALFGVVSNAINVAVYIKMGVKDPMNVSLLGLSISDFISCFTLLWFNLCLFPPFMDLELPFRQLGAHFLYGSLPHVASVKITTAITAFITIERCLCVTFPLKVKDIITTKRVAIITVFFFVLNIALIAPMYFVNRYAWVFAPERNRSLYSLVFAENRDEVEPTVYFLMGVFFPILAFISTILATIVLVYNLIKNSKWRQGATGKSTAAALDSSSSSGNQIMSSRDAKVAKMVVMISTLYLISFGPVMISTIIVIDDPEISEGGTRENLVHAIFYFNYLMEATNASLNILIYYSMSSNYKSTFKLMFDIFNKSPDKLRVTNHQTD